MLKILVSSCLLGSPVRYNAEHKKSHHPILERWIAEGRVVSACPEMLGGLGTPRPPAEIVPGGRVVTNGGVDVTAEFELGARTTAAQANREGVRVAILKSNSPSCGSGLIYDGSFTSTRVPGDGVAAALLKKQGIAVFTEEEIDAAAEYVARLEAGA